MAGWAGSRGPAGDTLGAPRPSGQKTMFGAPLIALSYVLIAYGVMQAIAYTHRLVADWREGIRFIAAIALLSALIFGALIAVGQTGQFAHRLATVLSYAALLFTLADLAHLNPGRRFAPVSSIVMIILGTLLLKISAIVAS